MRCVFVNRVEELAALGRLVSALRRKTERLTQDPTALVCAVAARSRVDDVPTSILSITAADVFASPS